jgi:hypothetical protein
MTVTLGVALKVFAVTFALLVAALATASDLVVYVALVPWTAALLLVVVAFLGEPS